MKDIHVFLGIVLCIAVLITPAVADVANISATADAEVRENQATMNFGADQLIRVSSNGTSDRRTLIKFDLSSIPAGSTINSATLTLFMDTAPGASRNHELHFSSTDSWLENAVTWNTQPALTSLLDSIATGTTSDVSKSWGAGGPNSGTEALTSRVTLEFSGDQVLTLVLKDQTESGSPNRQGEYTSKDTATVNPKPVLVVDYTLPVSCTDASIEIEAFNLKGTGPVEIGEYACFDIEFSITAGCKDLSFVKTQGGIGGNLTVGNIVVTKGSYTTSVKKGGNTIITWKIESGDGGLSADENQSLTATVCTGTNPKGKQEFTSCGVKPITGAWSSEAVVTEDSSIIQSTPDHTDRLEVEVNCPVEE